MGSLMLVNPKRKTRKRKTRTNPKRRKMSAKQAKYFGGGRKRRSRRHSTLRTNPKRRSSRRRSRRLHRNPIGIGSAKTFLKGSLLPAVIGGAGALAVDVAWAYAPIPAAIKTGPFAPLAKVAGAIALGFAVTKFGKQKAFGQAMVAGYLTVTAYDMLKKFLQRTMPAVPLSEYPYDLGFTQSGMFLPDESSGVSAYLEGPEGYGLTEGDQVGAYMDGYGDEVS